MDNYMRRGKIVRVIDGDTVVVEIDLGFSISMSRALRLAEINAPEMSTPEGKKAKEFLQKWSAGSVDWQKNPDGWFWIRTQKDKADKYGRYLAWIYPYDMADDLSVNYLLLEKGFAVEYK